jgi:hypothetical protein
MLKVPKSEIFDSSDFNDFYNIMSSWVGVILIFGGAKPYLVSDALAEHTRKELMRMLSMRISSLRACSACFEGTFSNLKFLCLC